MLAAPIYGPHIGLIALNMWISGGSVDSVVAFAARRTFINKNGEMVTSIAWSAIKRVRFSGKTCFVYFDNNVAWFFDRGDVSQRELSTIVGFAEHANVKLVGYGGVAA
jgi:hypothetical protein